MPRTARLSVLASILLTLLPAAASLAAHPEQQEIVPEPFPFSDRYPVEVLLSSQEDFSLLIGAGVDVGDVRPQDPEEPFPALGKPFSPLRAIVYVNDTELRHLQQRRLAARVIPNESMQAYRLYGPGSGAPDAWPTFEQYVTRMQALASAHPTVVRMISIGQSVQGRPIWMLKITDHPNLEEDEPEVKYTSTMHGNEPVGAEMTIRLAELLAGSYGTDPSLTELVDEMEIWLCPIHNPDGYVAGSRYNAHGVDLNRDFPDRFEDPVDDPAGREPETQAFMAFGYGKRFVMGANYHTGALVVNFPWDAVAPSGAPVVPELAPDDAIFYEFSVGYAARNPMILGGGFPNGVTRGWQWYQIWGGMQDWAYHWRGEHHVTIEISNQQPPPYSQMDNYWEANREAMLWWMRRALTGVRGRVTDAHTGDPLDASVDVVQIGKPVRTDPDVGDYHRLLLPGTYTLTCSAEGYLDQSWQVVVVSGTALVQDCAMMPESPYAVTVADSTAAGSPGQTITHTFYLTNTGLFTDSYVVTITSGAWPAALLDTDIGPLAPQQAASVLVTVDIPRQTARASVLYSDVLTLQVSSTTAAGVSASAQGRTYAVAELHVSLHTDQYSQFGLASQVLTYTLTVCNSGAYTDAYALSLHGADWPTCLAPTRTAALSPGQSQALTVCVGLPEGPGSGTDQVIVVATSGWDTRIRAMQALESLRYWGGVAASDSQTFGLPGQAVTHTFRIANASTLPDTYTVTLTPGRWPAVVLDGRVGPIDPGKNAFARVRVQIPQLPLTVNLLYSDVLALQVTSTLVPEIGARALGRTYAAPDLDLSLAAATPRQTGWPGDVVTYTLAVTNTGNYTDTYLITLEGGSWSSGIAPTRTSPLRPGEQAGLWVRVAIPAGPAGETDQVTVRAASTWNSTISATEELFALRGWRIYLPIVPLGASAQRADAGGPPGSELPRGSPRRSQKERDDR